MARLKTTRLWFETWTAELADAALNDRPKLGRMLGVVVPDGFPNQPVREFVLPGKIAELREDPGRGVWSGIIVHAADNTVMGSMGFKSPPDLKGMVEIGYDIVPGYQGRGYATEMARALISWAFGQPSVRRITAECLEDNWASIRVLQKVGMRRAGFSGNRLRWELSRTNGGFCPE